MKELKVRSNVVWATIAILITLVFLAIPAIAAASPIHDAPQAATLTLSDCSYAVRRGDTLLSIAARYKTSVYNLTQLNRLGNPNWIYAGMTLRLPCAGTSTSPGQGDGSLPSGICSFYVVRPGDNLRLIAVHFGITWQAIAQVNHLYNPNVIYTGVRLAIPCGSEPNRNPGQWKTFTSTRYHYAVNYPSNWRIDIQAPRATGPGANPEYVYLRPAATSLPMIEVYALKGAPPITGFENCDKNLVFKGIPACSISLPKGQEPAQQLLIFQKGESYYQIAIQFEVQQQLAVFEEIVKSFQFTH